MTQIPRSVLLCLLTSAMACAREPEARPDAGREPIPTERFAGVWSGPSGETGVVDLVVPRPSAVDASPFAPGAEVQGELWLEGVVGSTSLVGEVDAAGAELRFVGEVRGSIGRLSCAAALVVGSVRGKCTGSDQRVRDLETRGASGGAVRRLCGGWTDPLGEPAGAFNVLTQGGYAAAVFNSRLISGVAVGTQSGDTIALVIEPIGTAQGRLSGDTLSGTWTVPAVGGGEFSGQAARCPTGAGTPAPDAGRPDAEATPADGG